jgi:hypothetical protein
MEAVISVYPNALPHICVAKLQLLGTWVADCTTKFLEKKASPQGLVNSVLLKNQQFTGAYYIAFYIKYALLVID